MSIESKKIPTFSTFAVPFSGNRGSASMLISVLDNIIEKYPDAVINVFSYYPRTDKKFNSTNIKVYSGTPQNLAFKIIPLCLLYKILDFFRLKRNYQFLGKEINALLHTDVCLWIGGTTFHDKKLYKLPWNVASCLPGIILKKKNIFLSQTMGPFNNVLNKFAARYCLSKAHIIIPRGKSSLQNVQNLGFDKAKYFPDLAFSLKVDNNIKASVLQKYSYIYENKGRIVGISINTIVEKECNKSNINHNQIWADFISYLISQNFYVVLIPHSLRTGAKGKHNNDLISVNRIAALINQTQNLTIIDEVLSAKELREVVGLTDFYVASRFHSMISCLCTGTPVLVYGWGIQKYFEVMNEFGLDKYCHQASELSTKNIINDFKTLFEDADIIKKNISSNIERIKELSVQNHVETIKLAEASIL